MDKTITYLKTILNSESIVVIGCSGGPDSMCLLHLLCDLKKTIGFKIIVAHMNHKQREESDEEAVFVKNFSLTNDCLYEYFELKENIPSDFHSKSRIIRYNFFNEIIKKYHANFLMTAHHADDLMETILMRIARGSTLKGYSGFDLLTNKNGYKQVHPLIFYTKAEIKNYMDSHNYDYRIDNTNLENDYTRNRYRHIVLPFLKSENPDVHEKYYKFSTIINEADNFINKYLIKVLPNMYKNNTLNINEFKKEDQLIQKRTIEYILNELYPDNLYLVTDVNTQEIINAIYNDKPNISVKLPNHIILIKSYDKLIIDKCYPIEKTNIIFNGFYETDAVKFFEEKSSNDTSNYTLRLLSEEIKLPLILRHRQNGDTMIIKNMNNAKKLKDIFIDSKIPIHDRDNLLILTDSNDNILWLPGLKKSKFDKDISKKYDIILKYIKKGD